jgi:hypothetical protein
MSRPPARTRRLFPDGLPDAGTPVGRDALITRLLEDGDRSDLAWLAGRCGREALATWVARHGARRLSRRSRALWRAVFALPAESPPAAAEALWPLA